MGAVLLYLDETMDNHLFSVYMLVYQNIADLDLLQCHRRDRDELPILDGRIHTPAPGPKTNLLAMLKQLG